MHLISIFCVPKKKTKNKKNIYKKVDRKPKRVVYAKREPKERKREKIQKVDRKLERAVYAKGEQKKECERAC